MSEPGKINEAFREYYQGLYEAGPGGEEGDMRRFLDELEFPQVEEVKRQALEEPLELREVLDSIRGMKSGKAPGPEMGTRQNFIRNLQQTWHHIC